MSQGVGLASCLPKTAWPPTSVDLSKANIIGFDYTDIIDNPEVREVGS
ncbi:hypothetical protein OUHCRE19_43050 [Enterobacter asburiae]